MHHRGFRLGALVSGMLLVLTMVADAPAEKGGHGKGKGGPPHGAGGPGKSGNAAGKSGNSPGKSGDAPGKSGDAPGQGASKGKGAKFADDHRTVIRDYYRDTYETSGSCPPGLAKKNNGCMPPGQAKRRWNVGDALPADVVIAPLPSDLRVRLAPPLPGYDYGYVDGEVVLFATSGRIVVDFVALF